MIPGVFCINVTTRNKRQSRMKCGYFCSRNLLLALNQKSNVEPNYSNWVTSSFFRQPDDKRLLVFSNSREMAEKSTKICVVGAGIMGLSSAYLLAQQYPKADITIYAKEFPPHTTSNHGYGIVFCKLYNAKMYSRKIGEWSSETSRFCCEVTRNPKLAAETGIRPIDGFLVMSEKELEDIEKDPGQESIVTSPSLRASTTYFRESTEEEIREKFLSKSVQFNILLDQPKKCTKIENLKFFSYGTFIIDTDVYLQWLKTALAEMGKGDVRSVTFERRTVQHLKDLCDENFDLVVNCSGLMGGKLADDNKVVPIRAQWFLIRSPDITNLYYAGRTCICPRPGRVSLGSVFQWGRTDMEIDPAVTKDNWDRAKSLFPDLQKDQILGEYVRLRPGRYGGARLEHERVKADGKTLSVIHNYGHAGTGIGQHWGCALEVGKIARALLPLTRSKL